MFTDTEIEHCETYLTNLSRKYVKPPAEFNTPWRTVAKAIDNKPAKHEVKPKRKVEKAAIQPAKTDKPAIEIEVAEKKKAPEIDVFMLILDNAGALT